MWDTQHLNRNSEVTAVAQGEGALEELGTDEPAGQAKQPGKGCTGV